MPGFGDTAFIVFLALMLFGPKKLPVLAREFGKWMAEFRRASNEFKMQMEEEMRVVEQADKEKKIEAIESTAPATPDPAAEPATNELPNSEEPWEEHPHLDYGQDDLAQQSAPDMAYPNPEPIATSGDLSIMPPATGLPIAQDAAAEDVSLSDVVESIPEVQQTAVGPTGLSPDGTRRAVPAIPSPPEAATHG
jgi:sec-independent protein translocase protein TatB